MKGSAVLLLYLCGLLQSSGFRLRIRGPGSMRNSSPNAALISEPADPVFCEGVNLFP